MYKVIFVKKEFLFVALYNYIYFIIYFLKLTIVTIIKVHLVIFKNVKLVCDWRKNLVYLLARSLSYKTFKTQLVVIYDVILTLKKLALILVAIYENKTKEKRS